MQSMTGHGSAVLRDGGLDIEVEIRSVNHRFFNFKATLPPALAVHEGDIEKILRSRIARGSVTLIVSIKRQGEAGPMLPDKRTVALVARNLRKMSKEQGLEGDITLETLLGVPQLWAMSDQGDAVRKLWPRVKKLVIAAVEDHHRMRVREGRAVRTDVLKRVKNIETRVERIRKRSPRVTEAYRKRLLQRVNSMTEKLGVKVEPSDVVREVAIFADRCDISEELQRLQSHCRQYRKVVRQPGQIGRKLDFLTQEMGREANTLAAKGNDAGISTLAVEIKSEVEKLKEQAENVE